MKAFLLSLLIVVSTCFTLKAWAGTFPEVQVRNANAAIDKLVPELAKLKADADAARSKAAAPFQKTYAEKQKELEAAYDTLKKYCFTRDEQGKVVPLYTCGVLPEPTPPKAATPSAATSYDLDKLAKAVARHETGGCTLGSGRTHNNAFGIMQWKNGKRSFKRYETCEQSYEDFKRIWTAYYGRFPDLALAKKYSGNDRPNQWLSNVTAFYNEL